ncbi:MAG: hypothetical protein WA705_17105, partial [Candidatus Ozemobacteraceae bacterium]
MIAMVALAEVGVIFSIEASRLSRTDKDWGKAVTAARYLCRGDFDSGGQYCLGFGGALVDRRFSREVL